VSRIPTHTLESALAATRLILEVLAQRSPNGGQPAEHARSDGARASGAAGDMGFRRMLDEDGTLDRTVRTVILLTVAAAATSMSQRGRPRSPRVGHRRSWLKRSVSSAWRSTWIRS
jgi:hypothetical protein